MKQIFNILAILLLFGSNIHAQNKVMRFDGVNDYIDLGSTVGTGIRTIEMWFKPNANIGSSNNSFRTLIARNNPTSNGNQFNITFFPTIATPSSQAGTIRFTAYESNGTENSVYSNTNNWNANQWHHLAAIIHPSQGMMLFIDGVKQNSTNNYLSAPVLVSFPTYIGSWGNAANRFFNGSIDDVRFSDSALYTSNFTPACLDLLALSSTIGVWNFNDSSNATIAIDSSTNRNNGIIYGATGTTEDVCVASTASNVINFDGIDDYVDLGNTIGTGIRTIEMWFKPRIVINSNVNNFKTLVARHNPTSNNNQVNLAFFPSFATPSSAAGKIRFTLYDHSGTEYSVYSDANSWNQNQWYNIAAVVHPSQGMMLFVDGVKQNSTNNYVSAPVLVSFPTYIGSWGNAANRFFNGSIDDVRFSDNALYTSNFIPACPDLLALSSTIGVWNFNDNSNATIAIDSSTNRNNGIIYGAKGSLDTICQISTGMQTMEKVEENITVFPNPFNENVRFLFHNNKSVSKRIRIFSIDGKLVLEKLATSSLIIETNSFATGMYFYHVIEEGKVIYSNKLIKE